MERRKQGLIMNEKNKYCPHIEKREGGNQKCELAIPWTSVIPLIFMLDNCTEIHRKEANWLGECLFLHKQRSTPVIWSRLCVTHTSHHMFRLAAAGGKRTPIFLFWLLWPLGHSSSSLQELLARNPVNEYTSPYLSLDASKNIYANFFQILKSYHYFFLIPSFVAMWCFSLMLCYHFTLRVTVTRLSKHWNRQHRDCFQVLKNLKAKNPQQQQNKNQNIYQNK